MATTAKNPKEKTYGGSTPKLTPRPTAVSIARAARSATNRNAMTLNSQKSSILRTPIAMAANKARSPHGHRNAQKADSKTEVKVNPSSRELEPNDQESPRNLAAANVEDNNAASVSEENTSERSVGGTQDKQKGFINRNTLDNGVLRQIDNHGGDGEIVAVSNSRSRPGTPRTGVQTPRSRPQTPRTPSRPSTPVHLTFSRPGTPQRLLFQNRPRTPADGSRSGLRASPSALTTNRTRSSVTIDNDDIKTTYMEKQKQFHRMKKELDIKQQSVMEVFDNLRALRERLVQEVGSDVSSVPRQQQELVLLNVADWAAEEVAQWCRDANSGSAAGSAQELLNMNTTMDESSVVEVGARVVEVPAGFADLCLQAFDARQELIDLVKKLIARTNEDGGGEYLNVIASYNQQGLQLCQALHELKVRSDVACENATQLFKRLSSDRCALMQAGEALVREMARLRSDMETRVALIESQCDSEATKAVEELRDLLEEERAARALAKEKLSMSDAQVRESRARTAKMDRQLREADTTIATLSGTVKMLEDQIRQRQVQFDSRAHKLRESVKTGELVSTEMAHQRVMLETEIQDLNEQAKNMSIQHKFAIQELTDKMNDLSFQLKELEVQLKEENAKRLNAEQALFASENNIQELSRKLDEYEKHGNSQKSTEREMNLLAEVQALKHTLRMTEEEVTSGKRDKIRFLETMAKITESGNKAGMQQKFAAELISKEELIANMQSQIRELTKSIKFNEQKMIQYEKYVHDLKSRNRQLANGNGLPEGDNRDLDDQLMKLQLRLIDSVQRNEVLADAVAQKEQQLELQQESSRTQTKVLKKRDEQILTLKNKESEQNRQLIAMQQDIEQRMKIVGDVNKQIAGKANEIQELFTTLESKQQQIHLLEKIVVALEEQERRAQAQRTRHEEKIAALEHELAAGGNRRKYLFF